MDEVTVLREQVADLEKQLRALRMAKVEAEEAGATASAAVMVCPFPGRGTIAEFVADVVRPMLQDRRRERLSTPDTWCEQWADHPLARYLFTVAHATWPDPDDENWRSDHRTWATSMLPHLEALIGKLSPFSNCSHNQQCEPIGGPNNE